MEKNSLKSKAAFDGGRIPRRGDIWFADLPENLVGSEQMGTRPVVIIQTDWLNRSSTNVKVAIGTSVIKKRHYDVHYILPRLKGLPRRTMIEGEHVYTIDKSRLTEYRCSLPEEVMKNVVRAVRASERGRAPNPRFRSHHKRGSKSRMRKNRRVDSSYK